jgi:hypothetical protein
MFLEHDFYSNFSQSLQSGDSKMTNDIIIDELSELIVHDYTKIFDLLSKVGVRVSPNISDEQLVDILLNEMRTNKKLVRGLAFLIADKNELINSKTDEKSGRKYVDYVSNNLDTSFKNILRTQNETKKFKTSLMNQVKSKDSTVADRTRNVVTPSYFWRNVLIVTAIAGVSYLIYYNCDKITGKTKLAGGGTTIPQAVTTGATAGKTTPEIDMTPPALGTGSVQAPVIQQPTVASNG